MIANIGQNSTPDVSRCGGHGRAHRRAESQAVQTRAAHAESRVEQAGALQVTTADGDTVSISFAGLRELALDVFRAQSGRSAAEGGASSASSAMSVGVKVNGTLDDDEVADIQKLLGQMMSVVADARDGTLNAPATDYLASGSLESLQSFRFGYQENARARYGYVQA